LRSSSSASVPRSSSKATASNWIRRLEFAAREILPRAEVGPDAFYDGAGHLRPEFTVEMRLFGDFSQDLRRLGLMAGSLRARLEQQHPHG
jgi:hypothetical protein